MSALRLPSPALLPGRLVLSRPARTTEKTSRKPGGFRSSRAAHEATSRPVLSRPNADVIRHPNNSKTGSNSFRMNTYSSQWANPFRMRTYRIVVCKPRIMNTYAKVVRGVPDYCHVPAVPEGAVRCHFGKLRARIAGRRASRADPSRRSPEVEGGSSEGEGELTFAARECYIPLGPSNSSVRR